MCVDGIDDAADGDEKAFISDRYPYQFWICSARDVAWYSFICPDFVLLISHVYRYQGIGICIRIEARIRTRIEYRP